MNGVHDMGGMHGFGPVLPEENEPVFHAPWEGRIFGMRAQLSRFGGNIDMRRFAIESLRPDRYLHISYYERWLDTAFGYCEETGLIGAEERRAIETAHDETELVAGLAAAGKPSSRVAEAPARIHKDYARPIDSAPLFRIGDVVRAKNINPPTHTRLPRYARGKLGVVIADHGGFVFPDSNAVGKGEDPKRLYTVRFTARELWGENAHPRDTIALDLWEPYLGSDS